MIPEICRYDNLEALDWDLIYDYAVHRSGGINLDMWRTAVITAQQPTVELWGSDRYQIVFTPDEMLSLVGNAGVRPLVPDFAYLSLAGDKLRRNIGDNVPENDIPPALLTGRLGKATISKGYNGYLKNMENLHPDTVAYFKRTIERGAEEAAKRLALASDKNHDPYIVTLSVNPLDMCTLGLSSIDSNACFGPGGQGGNFPLALAQTRGGFYIEVRKKHSPWAKVGRAWGFMTDDFFFISNWYPNTNGAFREITPNLSAIVARRLGYPVKASAKPRPVNPTGENFPYGQHNTSDYPSNYTNGDQILFTRTNRVNVPEQIQMSSLGIPRSPFRGRYTSTVTGVSYDYSGSDSAYGNKLDGDLYSCCISGMGNTRAFRNMYYYCRAVKTLTPKEILRSVPVVTSEGPNEKFRVPTFLVEALKYAHLSDGSGVAPVDLVKYDTKTDSVVLK